MAATYDTSRSRALDRVRAKVRDTGQFNAGVSGPQAITGAISTDEEITALIASHGEKEAAAVLAEEHAAFYSLEPNSISQSGGMSYSYADRATALRKLAAAIRSQGSPSRGTGRYGESSPTITISNEIQY